MERKDKNPYNNYEFKEYKHSNKNKFSSNEINNEPKTKLNKDIMNNKNDANYKKPKIINKLIKENPENIINDNEQNPEIEIDQIKERIIKMRQENEKLRLMVSKRNRLISDLKDKCDDEKNLIAKLMTKIENIKNFIPNKSIKNKQKDKFEEQLAIAAVNEQIMKEICAGSDGHGVMNKIFDGDKKNSFVKVKIDQINQVYYKKNKYDLFECSICFDEFKENELLKQLNCNHIFHKECLSQWLLNEKHCPICQQSC